MNSNNITSVRFKESGVGTAPGTGYLDVLIESDKKLHIYTSGSVDSVIGGGEGSITGWTSVCVISGNYQIINTDTTVLHHATGLSACAAVTLPPAGNVSIGDVFFIANGYQNVKVLQINVKDSASEYIFGPNIGSENTAIYDNENENSLAILKYYGSGSWFCLGLYYSSGEYTGGGGG